jgi:hypothetical protein
MESFTILVALTRMDIYIEEKIEKRGKKEN